MAWPTHIVAASGYVLDAAGNILLVKTYNRGFDGTGGQIENGESIEEGVLREVLEESGITATVRALVGVYSNVGEHEGYNGMPPIPTKVMLDFLCDYVSGEPTPSEETSEVVWVPRARALSYITHPTVRYRLEKALHFDGRVVYASYVTHPSFQLLSQRYV